MGPLGSVGQPTSCRVSTTVPRSDDEGCSCLCGDTVTVLSETPLGLRSGQYLSNKLKNSSRDRLLPRKSRCTPLHGHDVSATCDLEQGGAATSFPRPASGSAARSSFRRTSGRRLKATLSWSCLRTTQLPSLLCLKAPPSTGSRRLLTRWGRLGCERHLKPPPPFTVQDPESQWPTSSVAVVLTGHGLRGGLSPTRACQARGSAALGRESYKSVRTFLFSRNGTDCGGRSLAWGVRAAALNQAQSCQPGRLAVSEPCSSVPWR